jgi:hypothetical protein
VDASVYVDAKIHVDPSNFSFKEKTKLVTNFGQVLTGSLVCCELEITYLISCICLQITNYK